MIYVFTYPGNESLAAQFQSEAGFIPAEWSFRHFPDGESYIRVDSDVQGADALVICSLHQPDNKLMPLVLLSECLRERGIQSITLLAPYLAYMRQDKSFQPGEAVAARYFAKLMSHYFDKLVTVDPHLHRIHSLDEIYSIPTQVIEAAPWLAKWIKENISNPLIIGPDEESRQWVEEVAAISGAAFTVLRKERFGDRQVKVSLPDISLLEGKTPVLIDDIISTGRTMLAAIEHLQSEGKQDIYCLGVHALFSGDAYSVLKASGAHIITCNTVPHETNGIEIRFEKADLI